MNKLFVGLVIAICFIFSTQSISDTTDAGLTGGRGAADGPLCPDADIWSGLLDKVCWSCMLPIKIMGQPMGSSGMAMDTPDGASTSAVCVCPDIFNVPTPGMPLGLWAPARLVESVRVPYCSPIAGGTRFKSSARLLGGSRSAPSTDSSELTFFNYHYWYFPLYTMLDIFLIPECRGDGYIDLDIGYLSELDPTWNDDELAFFLSPETAVFANPIAIASCAADAVASTAGNPIETMYWCAGSWGNMYPMTGHVPYDSSPVRTSSLITARSLAALHRRGLARKTMGDDAICGSYVHPMIPKSQYRFQQFYPAAEADGTCCHSIGASTFAWGEWRTYPGKGEDFVNLVWRYMDCCLR